MKKKPLIGFNKEWAKDHTEKEFVEQHKHLADEKYLKEAYNKIVKPEKKVKADEPAKEV